MSGEKTFRCREPDGRHVLRTAAEIVALNRSYYDTVAKQWKKGDPSAAGSNALTGNKRRWGGAIIIPPPPPPTINWQSAPSIPSGSADYTVPAGNYRQDDPTKPLFSPPTGKRVFFENSRLLGAGGLAENFFMRLYFHNCVMAVTPPTQYGKAPARLIRGKSIQHLQIENCTIPYAGLGIIVQGNDGWFNGDYTTGQGVFIRRNRVRGIDGRRSNGQGGFIRSGIGEAHYNSSQPDGQLIRANGGVVGFEIANFIQFLQIALTPFDVSDNEVLLDLGCVNEDIANWYGGSGARVEAPGFVRRNLFELTSRWDWNSPMTPGSTFQQDGMVRLNADSYQPSNDFTKSSDTGLMFGDANNLSIYAHNTSHITAEDNWVFGTRTCINTHNGHHLTLRRNRLYPTDRHRSGVLYTGVRYDNYETGDGAKGKAAADNPGEPLWGHHEFTDNQWYRGTTSGTDDTKGEVWRRNGGSATPIQVFPAITDGGVQLVQNWNAMQQAAGRVIGSTLPT